MKIYCRSIFLILSALASPWTFGKVDFTKDIRPILSEACFHCHGPDKQTRKAKLRLDLAEGATADLGGYQAVVPGKPGESELVARILSKDEDDHMPPKKSGKKLTNAQIEILKQWIAEGGKYEAHWAYRPVKKPKLPVIQEKHSFLRNEVDQLLLNQITEAGFKPSSEANKVTLARRLYLDLLGVPPTPEEADAFLKDSSGQAYEKLVERLLADPRFGERMAVHWLDLVRFADTSGYHSDNFMEVSSYRDYVIGAFNQNLPYDQFVIENIAGDLIPEATPMQKVASGYNRLLQTTEEGGAQADEYVTIYQADRVRNFGNVWLAATTGCAQCHDHKYDPITTKDFYSLAAFFADIKEKILGRRAPNFKLPSSTAKKWLLPTQKGNQALIEIKKQQESLIKDLLSKASKLPYEEPKIAKAPEPVEKVWIEDAVPSGGRAQGNSPWKFVSKPEPVFSGQKATVREAGGLSQHFFDGANPKLPISKGTKLFAYVYLDAQKPPKQIMLQFNDGSWDHRAYWGESKISWGKEGEVSRRNMGPLPKPGQWTKLEVDASHVGLKPGAQLNGWAFSQFGGKVYWDKAGAVTVVDPTKDPAFSQKTWAAQNKNAKDLPAKVQTAIKVPEDKRNADQKSLLRSHYLAFVHKATSGKFAKEKDALAKLQGKEEALNKSSGERSMLVSESTKPRMVKILPRGNWLDKSGEEVKPAIPSFLGKLETDGRQANRMDLAQWVVSKDNPLTSRAFVNRIWKLFFGYGLSRRLDDLGGQGEPPTNPELLDYLAADFRDTGWDVKRLIKFMVMSGTYRQSSAVSEELLEKDPANRLFARQTRFRLDAEFVRDTALSVSNLLSPNIGGKSVKPYQPAGYWRHLNFPARKWQQSKGDELYRRSLYTFVCRSFPHPAMVAFDAPSREECVAERPRSNIPQQALVLLNDPVFVEAARALAERLLMEIKGNDDTRLALAFKLALTREPSAKERQILSKLLAAQRERYKANPEDAKKLIATGSKQVAANLESHELAAWTSIARALLNIYETTARF
ncbi:MAG: peptidylprolyl isomerase [Opitutae bacterium]|nr:peptidylprolyl isomerase [Opitutae bacterium]